MLRTRAEAAPCARVRISPDDRPESPDARRPGATAERSRARSCTVAHKVGRRLNLAVWLLLAAYLALLVLRVVAFDQNRFFAAANSLTLWLLLPAYAIASAALLFRRFVMAGGALLVVVFHVVVVGPSIGVAEPIPDSGAFGAAAADRQREHRLDQPHARPHDARVARNRRRRLAPAGGDAGLDRSVRTGRARRALPLLGQVPVGELDGRGDLLAPAAR